MHKVINYLPFMQIVKDGRAYILLLPFNSEFDELKTVLGEFSQQVDQEKAWRDDLAAKAKLEQEAQNARQEAAVESVGV